MNKLDPQRSPIQATQFAPSSGQTSVAKVGLLQITTGIAAIFAVLTLGYLFTSKSVQLVIDPLPTSISISGGIALNLGEVYLLREGEYTLTAQTPLHETLKTKFSNLIGNNKLIITTEKDLMRLSLPKISSLINDLPVFYIPIEINFHGDDKKNFDQQITNYVRKNTTN